MLKKMNSMCFESEVGLKEICSAWSSHKLHDVGEEHA